MMLIVICVVVWFACGIGAIHIGESLCRAESTPGDPCDVWLAVFGPIWLVAALAYTVYKSTKLP